MSILTFAKYQGAGNDFILIDDRSSSYLSPCKKKIAELCHRRFGVGADGVILLQKDAQADFRMRIFNADGGEASSCGNGLRCLFRFLLDLGLPERKYTIAVGDRVVVGGYQGDSIFIEMGAPRNIKIGPLPIIGPWKVHAVDTGVPHVVVFVPDVEQVDLQREAPFLRHHPTFLPQGANINFAQVTSSRSMKLRTFERGVEAETWACGTGAAAAAVIASAVHEMQGRIEIECRGGSLQVTWDGVASLQLGGPARQVFSGTIFTELNSDHQIK